MQNYAKRTPRLGDFQRLYFQNQFSESNASGILADIDKLFFITRVESSGLWSITYNNCHGVLEVRNGNLTEEFFHPLAIQNSPVLVNVTKIQGFWINS